MGWSSSRTVVAANGRMSRWTRSSGGSRLRCERRGAAMLGRMPLNPDAVGTESAPYQATWTSKDALLYAVGIGAGMVELAATTENTADVTQQVFPTFAVVVPAG